MPFGFSGVLTGAAAIFFAYNGFDAVGTAAEETKHPNRDLPIGIIGSLLLCIVLYTAVALSVTGITNYAELNNPEPMAYALRQNGSSIGSALVGTGALTGMMAVLLVLMFGQSRIFFAMSRDGLLPKFFTKMHKKYETPYVSCLIVMVLVCTFGGLLPINTIANLTSIGILFALVMCSVSVMVLRVRRPKLERPFRCPGLFIVAPLAIIICGYLIYALLADTLTPFFIWITLSVAGYFIYAYRKSPLGK
jgi:APA family basic amino acid/polyamine antiporter